MQERDFRKRRERAIIGAKEEIGAAYASEEHTLVQAISAYNETVNALNRMYERLSEWYGIYAPEAELNDQRTLARLAMLIGEGSSDRSSLEAIVHDSKKAEAIARGVESTLGKRMIDGERRALRAFASMLFAQTQALEELDAYIGAAAKRVMPNVAYLTDDKIAAEILARAGSLRRLAAMPASTIQLLGAEKALFRHIKFGSKPPKYGVLFRLQEVAAAPRDKKGRIARAYAAKIAIAARADFYTKHFIAEDLKRSLAQSVERINRLKRKRRGGGRQRRGFR